MNGPSPIADPSSVALKVDGLVTHFQTQTGIARAVDGVSFEIHQGKTFALVGESGCGKSTVAQSIMRLHADEHLAELNGQIHLSSHSLLDLSEPEMADLRGNELSMIFQEPMTSLNPIMTIIDQITEVILRHQLTNLRSAHAQSIELLKQVRIPSPEIISTQYPHQLSGGMKQRVMIAIALACRPKVLIADEPTTALDVTVQAQILELLQTLQDEHQMSILLITHNLGVVAQNADDVAVMYAGQIVEQGPVEQILNHPQHPYTQKLISAIPSRHQRGKELAVIPGFVPPATRYPQGCRFEERCSHRMDSCKSQSPELIELKHQKVRCLLYTQNKESDSQANSTPTQAKEKGATSFDENPRLQLKELQVHFPIKKGWLKRTVGHVKAVDGVSLDIPRGQTLALVGESGCGKTTLGKCLARLISSTGGSIEEDTKNQTQKRLQMVFQDPASSFNPRMKIRDIISEGPRALQQWGKLTDRIQKSGDYLQQVGLDREVQIRYPHEFSGGQRQRIGIARALAVEPDFIICDEITSALDVSVQAQILNLLAELQKDHHLTYLFITHDLSVVSYLADWIAVMYLGRIVEWGRLDEVWENPKHPYTKALFSAVPSIEDRKDQSSPSLGGEVPSPSNPPQGCHFHPRCSEATDECKVRYPGRTFLKSDHSVCCYLYGSGDTDPSSTGPGDSS